MTFPRDVTVLVPTLPGRAKLLDRALNSIRKQTEPVVDIVVEVDATGQGATAVRNRALERVTTTWVAFLDDDDELLPDHLQVLLDGAESSGADLVYSYPMVVGMRDPLAVVYQGQVVHPFGVPFGPEQEEYLRNVGNFIPITHLCRTELVKAVGGFPAKNGFSVPEGNNSGGCEDYGLLLRLLDSFAKFHHVPRITWRYHFHDSNTGGKP